MGKTQKQKHKNLTLHEHLQSHFNTYTQACMHELQLAIYIRIISMHIGLLPRALYICIIAARLHACPPRSFLCTQELGHVYVIFIVQRGSTCSAACVPCTGPAKAIKGASYMASAFGKSKTSKRSRKGLFQDGTSNSERIYT